MATAHAAHRLAALAAGLALLLCAGPAAAQGAKGLKAFTVPAKLASPAFGPNAATSCPTYGVVGTVGDFFVRAADGRSQAAPAADGRLCALASILLDWQSDELPPPDALLFLARGLGLVTTPQQVVLTTVETEDPREIAAVLSAGLLDAARAMTSPRYGLATRRLAKRSTRVVLLAQDVPFDLAPLPRQLPLNGAATLSGTLLGALEKPTVVVSDAMGRAEEPAQAPGKAFKAELRCGDRPGRIFVLLRAEQDGAPRRLAGIPVLCGGALATTLPLEEQGWPADPAAQARLAFEQINAERTGAGLGALAWEEALAGVALALTEDLADEQLKGTSSGVTVTERLARAGLGSPLVFQNSGQSYTGKRAAEAFLESPVHRANLMNPEINAGGVALVLRTGPDGQPAAFITELFLQVLPPLDPVQVRADVRAGLIRRRAEAKVSAVTSDPFLEEVAQKYAAALAAAGGDLSDARSEELTLPVAKKYKEINLVPGAKADPMVFTAEPTLLGKAGKGLGVGTAQGVHPVLGKNAVYVVVITATKR